MYDGSPYGCEIPVRVEVLDPKLAEENYGSGY